MPTITNRPLLGQNGTGQRWATLSPAIEANKANSKPTVVSEPISPSSVVVNKPLLGAQKNTPASESSSVATEPSTTRSATSPTMASTLGIIPAAAPAKYDPSSTSSWEDQYINADNVDTEQDELTEEELRQRNLTLGHEEHHVYYNSTTLQNAEQAQEFLKSFQNLTPNAMLSKSHRRAMVITYYENI